jgi:hypothetical protein
LNHEISQHVTLGIIRREAWMKNADWELTSFPVDHRNTLGYSFQAALNKQAARVTTPTAPARESMTVELETV